MKSLFSWAAILLLLFTSAGAFYEGYRLVAFPDGSSAGVPLEVLQHTPFKNFFIPGIILFILVGVLGLVSVIVTIFQVSYHAKFIIISGLIFTVWVLVLMALSPEIYTKYYVLLFVGIGQLLSGLGLDRKGSTGKLE